MAKRIHFPMTWHHTVKISFYELSAFLTETEYQQMAGIVHKDVKVSLAFEYSPAEPEVGIPFDSFDYIGEWDLKDDIDNPVLENAVEAYLSSIDVQDFYGDEAYESYCNYCEYMRYGCG